MLLGLQGKASLIAELCRCLSTMMSELKVETVERMRLQAELQGLRAAQLRQNSALSKLKFYLSGGR